MAECWKSLPREVVDSILSELDSSSRSISIDGYFRRQYPGHLSFRSKDCAPVALSVDKRTRAAALSRYRGEIRYPASDKVIRFDPEHDVVLLSNYLQNHRHVLITPVTKIGLAQIKHLVILEGAYDGGARRLPTYHPNLERLSIAHHATNRVVQAVGGRPEIGFELHPVFGRYGRLWRDANDNLSKYKRETQAIWSAGHLLTGGGAPDIRLVALVKCSNQI